MAQMLEHPTNQVKRNVGTTDPGWTTFRQTVGMTNQQALGALLRALRKDRRMTQVAMATEIGIARSTLAGIEAGHDMPGRHTMEAIADFLGLGIDELRHGTVGPRPPGAGQLVKDPDELALLEFWRGLTGEQRVLVTRMLAVPIRNNSAA